jgi:hypothetical protein
MRIKVESGRGDAVRAVAELARPIKVDRVFDDPAAITRLVESNGPYLMISSYLPKQAVGGQTPAVLPWFRGTWAAAGRPLVDGADAILHNPRLLRAATELSAAEVTPNTVAVNLNAPMAAGNIHVDLGSFRGADRDRYPMQLLQAMGASGLFEDWRIIEVGAVVWFYEGAGGTFDYWPDGLDGEMRSERPPFSNVALVADNDRMYHRIGWIGDPDLSPPDLSPAAEIHHRPEGGWVITDRDRPPVRFGDKDVRISLVWKAQVQRKPASAETAAPLSPEVIFEIISSDLAARGVRVPVEGTSVTDQSWLDLVHSTYYVPVAPPT